MQQKEKELLEKLASIWNDFILLPEQHESDNVEFCLSLHRLQHLVMIRQTRRNFPQFFNTKEASK